MLSCKRCRGTLHRVINASEVLILLRWHYRELTWLSDCWSSLCTRMSSAPDEGWSARVQFKQVPVLADCSTPMKWLLAMHCRPRLIIEWPRQWVLCWKKGRGGDLGCWPFDGCPQRDMTVLYHWDSSALGSTTNEDCRWSVAMIIFCKKRSENRLKVT